LLCYHVLFPNTITLHDTQSTTGWDLMTASSFKRARRTIIRWVFDYSLYFNFFL
jgi:hypothetical protein